jgi:26S proteasome regulatory subunit N8
LSKEKGRGTNFDEFGSYKIAREKLIGWYHTGPKLRSSDLEINQVIKRYTSKPVMVIVDIRPDGERGSGKGAIPTDAYFAVEEIKDVSNTLFSL